MTIATQTKTILDRLGVNQNLYENGSMQVKTPITGEVIGAVVEATSADMEDAINQATKAFEEWRLVPAPRRGELVRLLGEE